jgi:hypothetical protein
MTTDSEVTATIDAALDYVAAALTGLPHYTETVAAAYGAGRISRGLSSLLILLIADAAQHSGNTPAEIIETMRENYGGITV